MENIRTLLNADIKSGITFYIYEIFAMKRDVHNNLSISDLICESRFMVSAIKYSLLLTELTTNKLVKYIKYVFYYAILIDTHRLQKYLARLFTLCLPVPSLYKHNRHCICLWL